jgi:hypothetical protein
MRIVHGARREQVHPAQDCVQRRSQFVGQRHQELVLVSARFLDAFTGALLALQRLFQPLIRLSQAIGLDPLHLAERALDLGPRIYLTEEEDDEAEERCRKGREADRCRATLGSPVGQDLVLTQRDGDDQ